MILYTNSVAIPTKDTPKRTLKFRVPCFYNYIIEAPTRLGYEVVDYIGNIDSLHRRSLWLVVFGFGFEYQIKWDGNGRLES